MEPVPPLVGREKELAQSLDALRQGLKGEGALILVGGEPGIGKSRLIEEVAGEASAKGAAVVWGRAWEAGGAPPFWPWVQAIRSCLRGDAASIAGRLGKGASDLAQIVPEISELLPNLPEPPVVDPDTARFRLFDAAMLLFREVSAVEPLTIVLEDLHAAEASSLLLLRFVARELRKNRIVLIGAYRGTDMTADLRNMLAEIRREPIALHLTLTGLTRDDVANLLEASGGFRPSKDLATTVHDLTEGNPLFVGEIGVLLGGEKLPDALIDRDSWSPLLPTRILDVIHQRLDDLGETTREILSVAAVLGRDFAVEVLERLSAAQRGELLAALDESVSARIVSETPDSLGRFRFSHALIRDVLYESLSPARKMSLHQVAGEVLELFYVDVEPHLSELAHHFFKAAPSGEAYKAIEYAHRAGERALRLLAYEEAIRMYGMALQVLELKGGGTAEVRCDLLLGLGDAQARAGDTPSAKATFLEAAEVARAASMSEKLARAALGYGGRFVWEAGRGDPHLVPLLEDALAAFGGEETPLRARVMARLGGGPMREDPDRQKRDVLTSQAVDLARRIGDPPTLAYVLDGRYAAVWWPENIGERLDITKELIDVSREAEDKERELQGRHFRLLAFLELGDREAAYRELEAKRHLAAELRQPAQLFYLATVEATLATFEGRLDEAEQLMDRAQELGLRSEESMSSIYKAVQLHALRWPQGRLDEVEELVARTASRFPDYFVLPSLLCHIYAELGRHEEAREMLGELGLDRFGSLQRNDEWLYAMTMLSEAAAALQELQYVEALYDLLEPFGHMNAVSAPDACCGSVSRPLGLLAAAMGRWDEADERFGEALGVHKRMQARPWAARTQLDWARMLLARDLQEDTKKALDLLRSALDTSVAIGASSMAEEAAKLLGSEISEATPIRRVVRTFMFTDIVKSTDLIGVIGDEAWQDVRRWHDRMVRELVKSHVGEEVNHTGDGFFLAFVDPKQAIRCAIGIQRALVAHRKVQGFAPGVRIGLHAGEALEAEHGYVGREVHTASRVTALAGAGEVVTTKSTVDNLANVALRNEKQVELRGIPERVKVAWLAWTEQRE